MSKHQLTVEEQRALARKLFAGTYDRLWRRSAKRKDSDRLTVTLDDVRKAFDETIDSIGTKRFLPTADLKD